MNKFQGHDSNKAPNELAKEIIEMFNKDQEARFSNADPEEIKQIDIGNTNRLKEIIHKQGYPTIDDIGVEASYSLWLLIQHADLDREFQIECLDLMKKLENGHINKKNIAYLEDRVRVGMGRPQLYGTQFYRREDKKLVLRDIEDIENVDKRRSEMNLGTLEESKKDFYSKCPKEEIPEDVLTD
jgi:hypothetical protein